MSPHAVLAAAGAPAYFTVPQLAEMARISRFSLIRRLKETERETRATILRRRGRCFYVTYADLAKHAAWLLEAIVTRMAAGL